jgi:hypothetical protein
MVLKSPFTIHPGRARPSIAAYFPNPRCASQETLDAGDAIVLVNKETISDTIRTFFDLPARPDDHEAHRQGSFDPLDKTNRADVVWSDDDLGVLWATPHQRWLTRPG